MSRYARRQSKQHKTSQGMLGLMNIALFVFSIILAGILAFVIYTYQLLNFKGLNYIALGAMAVFLLFHFIMIAIKKLKIFTTILLSLFIIFSLGSLLFIKSLVDVSDKMNSSARFSEFEMSVVVPIDSPINNIKEIDELSAPLSVDKVNIDSLLLDVKEKENHSLKVIDEASYDSSYKKLLSGESKAMIINGAFASLSENGQEIKKLKKIYSYTLRKKIETSANKVNKDVMNIYISGVDTYGPISTVSRSDVNIIMTINRRTNQILLTTTPRDTYVPIAGGGQNQGDKLTHAGIYGVESSIATLENLYDIDIDYYAKINFTSFINLIDLLDGVEVDNDQAFSAGGFDFPVGKISMSSKQALVFVRERYSLEHGDNDRGKNQTKVIKAIVEKLVSVKAITNYQQIINGIGDSIQTNMPLVKMLELANGQLESGNEFTITSQALEGTGSTGELPSFAMPNAALYMVSINSDSLSAVKDNIKSVMEGK